MQNYDVSLVCPIYFKLDNSLCSIIYIKPFFINAIFNKNNKYKKSFFLL